MAQGSAPAPGSPPPMRGKAPASNFTSIFFRITPAHAGKSVGVQDGRIVTWDHPRPCGEKPRAVATRRGKRGSPPPMRGKVVAVRALDARQGITPAHAGKRDHRPYGGERGKDHPRPCGEKRYKHDAWSDQGGSPPPMRGKAEFCRCASHGRRITPAHAGKRVVVCFKYRRRKDHPRPCGEKTKKTPKYRHFRFSNQSISFSFSYT